MYLCYEHEHYNVYSSINLDIFAQILHYCDYPDGPSVRLDR